MPATPAPDAAACDVLVVGGGINGAGIARDLAGRGLTVVLCEKDDLAAHTSSRSTKLIHGGLRYLEHRQFGLVRKALQEREILLRSAPHIIRPLRFVMPHDPSMRPAWMIRLGLFLYDHLARRELLLASATLDLRTHPAGVPLKTQYARGFEYSDGWADDARLVVLNAVDAAQRGARVLTRTVCTAVEPTAGGWRCTLRNAQGRQTDMRARAVVNATGPWAAAFLREQVAEPAPRALRLVKGSHIVVPRLFDHAWAYLFQNPDGRVLFAIPYEDDYTLIGTTEVEHHIGPDKVGISEDEIAYLCTRASRYFRQPVTPAGVVWSYAGVRPLLDDASGAASAVTRDYRLELSATRPPLLSVWGGKITTFRRLAEEAADRLCCALDHVAPGWTATVPLPGGDLGACLGTARNAAPDVAHCVEAVSARHPWLPRRLVVRLLRAYGSRIDRILGPALRLADLGDEVAPDLFEAELRYLCREEWAVTAEDVLWRRSKLGLRYTPAQRAAVGDWLAAHAAAAPSGR